MHLMVSTSGLHSHIHTSLAGTPTENRQQDTLPLNPEEETVPHPCQHSTVFAGMAPLERELLTFPHPECPSKDVSVRACIQVTNGQVILSLSLSLHSSHLTTLCVPEESQNLQSQHPLGFRHLCSDHLDAFSEVEERGRGLRGGARVEDTEWAVCTVSRCPCPAPEPPE